MQVPRRAARRCALTSIAVPGSIGWVRLPTVSGARKFQHPSRRLVTDFGALRSSAAERNWCSLGAVSVQRPEARRGGDG